ncbi:MAG: Coenzyme F420 hydrogenase/dehydrogenase, beta subunit C-terminal domain, partial [Pseudomonadota bacterium]
MIEHPDPALGTSPAPYRSMCTDCGISRSSDPGRCGRACQFIAPDYPGLEAQVHGRSRHSAADQDELFFGVHTKMWRAVRQPAVVGAQWTGITTLIGEQLLSGGHVDAVLAVVPDPDDRWKPKPALLTAPEEMAHARGMRMGYAPLLALLETARAHGFARLAVIGIPCQVYALRALERELGFDELFVIGTPCSDNTTTDHFHTFLAALTDQPDTVSYLEFRPDYQVEMRFDDGARRLIPFIKLPLSQLPENFFPLTCQTCVDYTNALSDLTVGYMAADGEQWLIVRNARGARLLNLIN